MRAFITLIAACALCAAAPALALEYPCPTGPGARIVNYSLVTNCATEVGP